MARADRNLDLLACLLAVQGQFVRRDLLIDEFRTWLGHRTGPLIVALNERKILTDVGHRSLETLVQEQLARHGGDVARCLSSLQLEDSVRLDLEQIDDLDLLNSLQLVGRSRQDDLAVTQADPVGGNDGGGPTDIGDSATLAEVASDSVGLVETLVAPSGPEDREIEADQADTQVAPSGLAPPRTILDDSSSRGEPLDSLYTRVPDLSPGEGLETICEPGPGPHGSIGSHNSQMRFRIVRAHARGGLGEVSVAHDEELRREVALKEIRLTYADHPESQRRFLQEAEITGSLEHPGVVPVYGLGRYTDGRPYYAMRFIRGKSLKQAIEELHAVSSDPCSLESRQLLGRFGGVCNTIAYAHSRRILHRDIKPDNVMLGEFGETLVVDWGLAKQLDETEGPSIGEGNGAGFSGLEQSGSRTLPGSMMGTPQYMSPEQASGHFDRLSPASDIYSLGGTLFCLLTGKPPYGDLGLTQLIERVQRGEFPRPRSINGAIPPALEAVCLKAMRFRPEDRYESAGALADDVERWLADLPVSAWSEPWTVRLARWARRHRTWVQAGAVALLVVTAMALASTAIISAARRSESNARRREDEQRRFAESYRQENARRLISLRGEAEEFILKGQQALDSGQASESRLMASRALAALHSEPELADLRAHADRLLLQSDRQLAAQRGAQVARDALARFRKLHDQALFHGTLLTGLDQAESLEATRVAAREALSLYGLDADGSGGSIRISPDLGDAERREVETACYELLLVHAEAVAQPPSSRDAGDPRAGDLLALRILDQAERLGGPSRALQMRRAQYRERLGDEAGARADRERAESLAPNRAVDAFLLGEQWYRLGEHEKAINALEGALRLQPDHFWAQYFLAACHLKLDRPAMAKAGLTACLARHPEFLWIYLLRGYVHGKLKEYEAAEADFRHVLERHPDDPTRYGVHVNRGAMRLGQGRADEAIDDLQRAIRLKPSQYQAYANLGLAYQALDRRREAREQFDRAIELAPGMASLHSRRARIIRELGDLQAALSGYEAAIRLEPAGSRAAAEDHKERGRILHQLGRFDGALEAYGRALAGLPDDRELQRLRADALLAVNRGGEALDAFNRYLGPGPGDRDAEAYRLRGFERARAADHAGALADYTSALDLDPNSALTRGRRGWSFLDNSARLALRDFEAAIKLDPVDGDLYNGRGYASALLGRHREAVKDAEKALELGPRSPDPRARPAILYNAACIYALASGSAEHEPEGRKDPELVTRYRDRAVEIVRKLLDAVPDESRGTYLRQILDEPAFLSIRDHPPLMRLVSGSIPSAPPVGP